MDTKGILFSYYWFIDNEEEEITSIRIYGVNNYNKNICLRVDDFQPYIYLELPVDTGIIWNSTTAQYLGDSLDQLMKNNKPLSKTFCEKYKLYGANIDKKGKKLFLH